MDDEPVEMNRTLAHEETESLLKTLEDRFMKNTGRHPGIQWNVVRKRLLENPERGASIYNMEKTGGEPDVIAEGGNSEELVFYDCSPESPMERRNLCYDRKAWETRKENRPKGNIIDLASSMGIEVLDEEHYRILQSHGEFDTKTSSWLRTPSGIRALGGAIFGDRRYGQVFIYHNGASSYYSGRGFRGLLRL